MYITKEDIQRLASSSIEFHKGEDYYEQEKVGKVKVTQKDDCLEIMAQVTGLMGDYKASIEIYNQKIAWHECDCLASFQKQGLCKHMVAVLLKYCYEVMPQVKRGIKGEKYSQDALAYYEEQMVKEQEIEMNGPESPIKAAVRLVEVDRGSFALNLSVGETRLYVVKDLYEFTDNMRQGYTASYGKNLEFIHDINMFDEKAQPIVSFIMDKAMEYTYILKQMGFFRGFPKSERKALPLNAKAFDEFFEIVQDSELDVVRERDVVKVLCLEGNPSFNLKIEKEEDHYVLSSSMQEYISFESASYKYILTDTRLYRLTKGFAKHVYPLLEHMYDAERINGNKHLEFNENLMKRFMLSSLEKVKEYVPLIISEDIQMNIEPERARVRSFFDMDQSGGIIGEVELEYKEIIFNPYKMTNPEETQKLQEIARDTPTEFKLNGVLRRYDFHTHNGHLLLSDEDKIYDFLNTGINEMLALGEVNITERLRGIKIVRKPIGTLGIKLQNNMLFVALEEINMPTDEIQSILAAYRHKSRYYRLRDGSFLDLREGITGDLVNIVEGLGIDGDDLAQGEVAIPKYRALYLDQILKQSEDIEVNRDRYFKQIIRDVKNVEDADFEVPKSIRANLRSYQKVGYRWLRTMANYGFGGILADDMGLGKTLQIITLLTQEYDKEQEETHYPSLVVCPTSLVLNWQAEFNKFAPHIKVLIIMGTIDERKMLYEQIHEYDVVVTSYDLLKRDIENYGGMHFKYCIADEAQYIKNANTIGAKALKMIESEVRFALTGTPIENSLAELWSIFDFIMPGYLFSYSRFKNNFEMPIVKNEDEASTNRLKKMLAPFIMRRLKKDVLKELPDKIETVVYNNMEETQQKLYTAHLALARQEISKEVKEKGTGGSRIKMLALLTRLRQLCCHPSLYLQDYEEGSGKLEQCMEIIKDSIEAGHKILLFSQFTSMLDIISRRLRMDGIDHLMLTGSTKAEERIAMVSEFNHSSIPIFLISLKAGGTGLNLTGADVVIHYDPWWNLSSQNQATDRAYRIGQKKNVQVFQMITKNSIEEKIKELQDKKIGLTESVLQEGEAFISQMSEEEIVDLFSEY
ncbi:MAG: SNF2 helicase associated domain-containing protein [Cellulosilyticum sp.]|nr:SNF2 helicase associated domain-containing protein [Cellulosilyticum sp.]